MAAALVSDSVEAELASTKRAVAWALCLLAGLMGVLGRRLYDGHVGHYVNLVISKKAMSSKATRNERDRYTMVLTMITPKHDVPRHKQIPARGLRRLTIGRLEESLNGSSGSRHQVSQIPATLTATNSSC